MKKLNVESKKSFSWSHIWWIQNANPGLISCEPSFLLRHLSVWLSRAPNDDRNEGKRMIGPLKVQQLTGGGEGEGGGGGGRGTVEKGMSCLPMLVKPLSAWLCLVVQDSSLGDCERMHTVEVDDTGFTLMFLGCRVSGLCALIDGICFVFRTLFSPQILPPSFHFILFYFLSLPSFCLDFF